MNDEIALIDCVDSGYYRNKDGYAKRWDSKNKVVRGAHQLAWIEVNGPVPEGLEVSHLCHVRWCVYLEHLIVETHHENVTRMARAGRHWSSLKEACKRGHREWSILKNGDRRCKACSRMHTKNYRARKAAANVN